MRDEEQAATGNHIADDLVVVGVGASAGGLEAFQELIAGLGPGHERAYVLVQHLDPDHESLLPELLARRAKVPVHAIRDGMRIEHGTVYLIPPGASLTVKDRTLRLTSFGLPRGQRRPIDVFFESLAADLGSRATCIILSGTGSDGTAGARAIKEAGGLVFVQDPKQAKYDGMPKSAIATNAVDLILPVGDMIGVLDDYFTRRSGLEPQIATDEEFIERVAKHIRYRTGHDFSRYKKSTLMRRLARRMSVLGVNTPQDYLQKLIHDQSEASHLFRDVLINVTSFFRDPEMFETLRQDVLPRLVQGRGRGDEIRIWVPGCSTGQEAYSIAILLEEELSRVDARPKVSIFATDIDPDALHVAREAVYPNMIASEVPSDLLDRHFTSSPQGYRVSAAVRETVRISMHSVIKDPPFSKLDLVSCRNLLIYLENDVQEQTLKVFHYALKPGGFLFLGPSENLGPLAAHFLPVNATDRIYARAEGASQPLALPLLAHPAHALGASGATRHAVPSDAPNDYERAVLARHTPPFVVVNEAHDVVYSSGRTSRYLELPPGRTQFGLINMSKEPLRAPLRSLIAAAPSDPRRVVHRTVEAEIDEGAVRLFLSAERQPDGNLLIVFQDRFDPTEAPDDPSANIHGDQRSDETYVRDLEQELDNARQTIRTTVEELETSNEELKSSNEEMMSMNEELQSANEELSTINDELQNKIKELNTVNDDQRNLIESTRIATIFLDEDLCIRSFTPDAARHFRLVDHDVGRPFEDIVSNLVGEPLVVSCRTVLHTRRPVETKRASTEGNADLLVRINPYLTKSGPIAGVIMTLTDVTELSRYARALEEAKAAATLSLTEIEEIYRVSPQAKALIDRNLRYLRVNQIFADLNEQSIEAHLGRRAVDVVPELGSTIFESARRVFETGEPVTTTGVLGPVTEDGVRRIWDIDWYPVRRDEEIYAVGVNVTDVTKFKVMETELRRLMRELQHRVKNMLANVTALINRARRERGEPEMVLETLVRRIQALATTHNLLTARNWRATRLIEVLRPELTDVYGSERVTLKGPEIRLNARATLALAMAVHELATNAAKYGALSEPDGFLHIAWMRIDDGEGDNLVIQWREEGGPSVSPPGQLGFGSQLVRTTIEGSLAGRFGCDFAPTGFTCTISIPFDRATGDDTDVTAELESA